MTQKFYKMTLALQRIGFATGALAIFLALAGSCPVTAQAQINVGGGPGVTTGGNPGETAGYKPPKNAVGYVTGIATGLGGDGIYITLATNSPTGCPSENRFYMPVTAPLYKEVFALAMTARVAGTPLVAQYAGCADSNWNRGYDANMIAAMVQ